MLPKVARTLILAMSLFPAFHVRGQTGISQHKPDRPDDRFTPQLVTAHARARPGEPKSIQFSVDGTATYDRTCDTAVEDVGIAKVVDAGRVRAGETLGYAVIQALKPGKTSIRVGTRSVELVVSDHDATLPTARIVAPAHGATAWGQIEVGIEWWKPDWPEGQIPSLQIGTGKTIEPCWTSGDQPGPTGLASFHVDLTLQPEGPLPLSIIRPGQAQPVDTIRLNVIATGRLTPLEGECEAVYDLPPLPEGRTEKAPTIQNDKAASGGKYWSSASAAPRFRFPLDVPESGGQYQLILTAGGDQACAALPVVGVAVDDGQYTLTRSSIASAGFHRVPIGVPINLAPGQHVLRLEFLNDFYGGRGVDRNLRLDKFELARIGAGAAATTPAEGQMAMMQGVAAPAEPTRSEEAMAMTDGAMGMAMSQPARRPLHMAIPRLFNGAEISGDFEVRGAIQWPREAIAASTPPCPIALVINGQEIDRQISVSPRFQLRPGMLRAGPNTVQLKAVDTANPSDPVQSPSYSVSCTAPLAAGSPLTVQWLRRTIWDSGWNAASRALLSEDQSPSERMAFAMYSNAAVELSLPDSLEGEYTLAIESRGQAHKGPPRLEIHSLAGNEGALAAWTDQAPQTSEPVGIVDVPSSWGAHAVVVNSGEKRPKPAAATFRAGPKRLRIAFTNDTYEPEVKGDRNVWVQAVVLARVQPTGPTGTAESTVVFAWPSESLEARTDAASAVVISARGPEAPISAELAVDGAATGQLIDLRNRAGPFVLPVSLRGIQPGDHRLTCTVRWPQDRTASADIHVHVRTADSPELTSYERAVIILDRLAYGPDERSLASILTRGEDAWLSAELARGWSAPDCSAATALARSRYPDDRSAPDVQRRAILEGLTTLSPVRTKFVLWTQNHFSTWIRKAEARRKADEHERFSRVGIAPFADLLRTSATSPAMLRYLDQEQSFVRKLNENYAREIMELHTLGVHGGYTQEDVTTLARILTGWTGARVAADSDATSAGDENGMTEVFRFDPRLSDDQPRVFLGRRFDAPAPDQRYSRVLTAMDMLAAHPSTARFISQKIASHYTVFPPPPDLVDHLASTFASTGGDMGQILTRMVHDPAFWHVQAGARVCHPVEFSFRLSRCCRGEDAQAVHDFLNLSGQGMFDRSTPDGYQEDDGESMDSNAMLQRWKFARRLEPRLLELIPTELRNGEKPIEDSTAQAMTDQVAMRLTGRLLADRSNQAAMTLFRSTEGRREERWRQLVTFIASCPEAQSR